MKKTVFIALLLTLVFFESVGAQPAIWSTNSRTEVVRGDSRGVSIVHDGAITLAPRWSEVFRTEQPYIWSTAVDQAGNVFLGTGGDGKIFKVTPAGAGALFADLAELNVTALVIATNGDMFAATSPDGKVYKIGATGTATVYFSPGDKYIWSLAALPDGSLAVGSGDGGRIYKVRSAGADPAASLLFDTSESHIICLAVDAQGNLYAGTDSNGLVMRFGTDGKPFGVLDSPLREIHELAVAADGSVYVLALGESASAPKPADAAAPAATPENKTVTVERPTAAPEPAARSRYDLTGARSAVYRLTPGGGSEILWTSTAISGFSIAAGRSGNGVLLGTSEKGRVYEIGNDGCETLLLQSGTNQISSIRAAGSGFIAASSNPGVLHRLSAESVAEGTYESPVLDAKNTATWGRLWWTGVGDVSIQTRAGNTERPDETWSGWSAVIRNTSGAQIASPHARYLQWRAVLRPSAVAARLTEVNAAFIARNIAPEILSIQIHPTNVGLIATPGAQIDPNIALSGLDTALFGIPTVVPAPRRVFMRGATSIQWTSEDRNGDDLIFDVLYREVSESEFKPLKTGLTESFLAIDGQALADGQYVFRVVARDLPSNPAAFALSGERTTGPVNIDNTAPVVTAVGNSSSHVTFEVIDRSSYVVRAEYSINAGPWSPIYPEDGIADSPSERFSVPLPVQPGEYSVTLRAFDVNGNAGNARRVVRK